MNGDRRLTAEELPIGEVIDLGEYWVSRDEIIQFARQWDPMPFHVDPEFARHTVFGDVIGSGMHTMAVYQRLAVLGAYRHWAIVAGRAIRGVDLTSPLRPDTTVRATVEIDSVTATSLERALVSKTGRVLHKDLELMSVRVDSYVLRRQ